jgi:hypothetical protein
MAKCAWCGQEFKKIFGTEAFCSHKCQVQFNAAHPSEPGLLDAGIDIVTSIHEAKKAKRAAKERAEEEARKREREYWNSPEGRAKTAAYEAEEAAKDARSLEGWLGEIDQIVDERIKHIEEWFRCHKSRKTDEAKASVLAEAKEEMNQRREEAKGIIRKYYPSYHHADNRDKQLDARYKVRCACNNIGSKLYNIESKAEAKAYHGGSKLFTAFSVLITLWGIILGVKEHVFMLTVIGFIAGYVLAEIAFHLYYDDFKTKLPSLVTCVLGCPYLLIISIILGAGLHSFRLGLIGAITAIVLFVVGCLRIS